MRVEGQRTENRRKNRIVPNHRMPDERQTMARGVIRRMLIQFHREWDEIRERESGSARILTSSAMLDRCSHQLYSAACDMKAALGEELARELRCLSAEIIETVNILIMLGCGEECREESEALAKEAILRIERCLTLVQRGKGCAATRIPAAHREE